MDLGKQNSIPMHFVPSNVSAPEPSHAPSCLIRSTLCLTAPASFIGRAYFVRVGDLLGGNAGCCGAPSLLSGESVSHRFTMAHSNACMAGCISTVVRRCPRRVEPESVDRGGRNSRCPKGRGWGGPDHRCSKYGGSTCLHLRRMSRGAAFFL